MLNTANYPGRYDPVKIKDFMCNMFTSHLPPHGPYTETLRDVVIGSIQNDLGYNDEKSEADKEIEEKRKRRRKFFDELPEAFRKVYLDYDTLELQEDKKLVIAIYFEIPDEKSSNINKAEMFSVIQVPDCLNLVHALDRTYALKVDELLEKDFTIKQTDSLVMNWAPWVEVAKEVAN